MLKEVIKHEEFRCRFRTLVYVFEVERKGTSKRKMATCMLDEKLQSAKTARLFSLSCMQY